MSNADVGETCADSEETRQLLVFGTKTKLDEGLGKFVQWYRD